MNKQFLRSAFSAKTLLGRFLLIFLIPIIVLQIVNTYIFYQRHWDNVSDKMQSSLVEEIMVISNLIKTKKDFFDQKNNLSPLKIYIKFLDEMPVVKAKKLKYKDILHGESKARQISSIILRKGQDDAPLRQLKIKLEKELQKPFLIRYSDDSVYINIDITITDGVLSLSFPTKRVQSSTANIFIAWMVGLSVFLYTVAMLFMRKQVESIAALAECADKMGKGNQINSFRPSGAEEIKNAGEAIIKMRDRIERQVNYRTEMLAHISHDIRTPLTRMKLQLALLKDDQAAQRLNIEIDYIDNMVEGYLNFAKEEGNEESEKVNIKELVDDLLSTYKNEDINFICYNLSSEIVTVKKYALKRALANLLDNALKHYKNKIEISLKIRNNLFNISVDDDGNGIDESLYNDVFRPFFKADKESKGHGLGLTIVKSIVQSHGGNIYLAKSPLGGLKVYISIPI